MAYLDSANLASDSDFRLRVRIGIVSAAIAIVGEAPSDPPNPDRDSKRKFLGIQVINNSSDYVDRFAFAVSANPAVTETSNDGDIQVNINSLWDDIAGV